jgi:hypothetical protein
MAYYLDFVGLNTFIYEPVGYDPSNQRWRTSFPLVGISGEMVSYTAASPTYVFQNSIGCFGQDDLSIPGPPDGIYRTKNYLFPYNLSTTASFFPALMLHRNGPYGWPTWKQIRVGKNPLSRKQRKENIFTIVQEPGPEIQYRRNNQVRTVRGKFGGILKYNETPVIGKFKPIKLGVGSQVLTEAGETVLEKYEIAATYANETIFFNNNDLSKRYNKLPKRTKEYEELTGFYLNGALNLSESPFDTFQYLKYGETVYPPQVYANKNYVRQRTTFTFPWKDSRGDRTELVDDQGFGSAVTQSMFVMDAYSTWDTQPLDIVPGTERWQNWYGYEDNSEVFSNYGILQNQYSFGIYNLESHVRFDLLEGKLKPAPLYNRKHNLSPSSSVVSPNGMRIEGINTGATMNNITASHNPGGEAKWEAGSQSGLNPFYDSYDDYVQGVRQKGKGYSIVPEFKISDLIATYQASGSTTEIPDFLSLTGGLSDINVSASSGEQFYKVYTNSDFLKHFDIVREDHKEFVDPFSITLKCKGIKKLLPYEGFYPAQRTAQMAKQFYDSYKSFIAVSGAANYFGSASSSPYLFQNLMVPTFAPGIMFNSIKAGVACDYPVITSSISIANQNVYKDGDDYYLTTGSATRFKVFDRRIPFEAIVDPEDHLTDRIYCNEPHIYANNSGSVLWDGNGDNLYKLMANNFMAETANFFLKDSSFTSITSGKSTNPNVGNAQNGKKYMMRIKMYKSQESGSIPLMSASNGKFYTAPQYASASYENFTMYSRPSAFGPPSKPLLSTSTGSDSGLGENYAFTPPYYYGQAWADLTFQASDSKKYSISEIISSCSVNNWRYVNEEDADQVFKSRFINGTPDGIGEHGDAMPLSASVNIFQQVDIVGEGMVVDASNTTRSRWAVQMKYETPMLNFAHLSSKTSITLPTNASQSVPRGMWHQYGQIESDPAKGVFLQVTDVPSDWIDNALVGLDSAAIGSLADLCGFPKDAVKLGQAGENKVISEAVVAIPFVEQEGERKYFKLSKVDIQHALGLANTRALVGDSVLDMVDKMKRFVFPPSMDFINDEAIDPFAMYIFEFKHTLSRQDLTDIWQNLYPKVGREFEEVQTTISHGLLAQELLGGGAVVVKNSSNTAGALEKNAIGNELPKEIRWMVFKVKQRAEIDYYKKVAGNKKELGEKISYNWPYDFFSLVELVKLDAEITLAKREVVSIPEDSIVTISSKAVDRGIDPPLPRSTLVDTSKTISAGASIATSVTSGPTSIIGDYEDSQTGNIEDSVLGNFFGEAAKKKNEERAARREAERKRREEIKANEGFNQ